MFSDFPYLPSRLVIDDNLKEEFQQSASELVAERKARNQDDLFNKDNIEYALYVHAVSERVFFKHHNEYKRSLSGEGLRALYNRVREISLERALQDVASLTDEEIKNYGCETRDEFRDEYFMECFKTTFTGSMKNYFTNNDISEF